MAAILNKVNDKKERDKTKIPNTKTEVGSAKRNILRKTNKGKGGGGGGGGGKGKAPGQKIDDGSTYYYDTALDEHDLNYEEDDGNDEEEYFAELTGAKVAAAPMTLTQYKRAIEPIITEYFDSGDVDEILICIQEINVPSYTYEFVKRAVNMSFDRTDRERELISKLFSLGYPDVFSTNMLGKGFERLFELIDEIEKDAPKARDMLATYVARAVVDDILPPSFLSDAVVCNLGGDIIDYAKRMLSRDHGGAKIEKSWGPGDGRPVEELKVAIDQIFQEFLVSGDKDEASNCLKVLRSPHFFHEVVKRAVVQSMDSSDEQQNSMSSLLKELSKTEILTKYQTVKGFDRLHALINDIKLDTPNAPDILQKFTSRAIDDGILPKNYQPAPAVTLY